MHSRPQFYIREANLKSNKPTAITNHFKNYDQTFKIKAFHKNGFNFILSSCLAYAVRFILCIIAINVTVA